MPEAAYNLTMYAEALRRELTPLRKLLRRATIEFVGLSYDGDKLTFTAPGLAATVVARGQWPTTPVKVQANLVSLLIDAPDQAKANVRLSYDGQRLHVGDSVSLPAEEVGDGRPAVDLLPPANLLEALCMGLRYPAGDLRTSGLYDKVREARVELDKRLERAAKALAPLGIDKADLGDMVDARLRRLIGDQNPAARGADT
jgi:hypothetical protein